MWNWELLCVNQTLPTMPTTANTGLLAVTVFVPLTKNEYTSQVLTFMYKTHIYNIVQT